MILRNGKSTICAFEQLMIPYQERKGGYIIICIIAVSRAQKARALWDVSKRAMLCRGKKAFCNERHNHNRN